MLRFLALAGWFGWTALTLLFANLSPQSLCVALALGYLAVAIGLRVALGRRGLRLALGIGAVVALGYVLTRPSNDRDWQPDVAVAPTVEIDGDRVVVRGVRNFTWRSDEDFDVAWEDREYDLARLRTLDLVMSYWGPTAYCHTLVSFGFEGGEQLAVSVETRKEAGEEFSTFAGLFKRFELVYVFADERDVLGVRARCRGEELYLYRLRAGPERVRELFLSYAGFADRLAREPEFYGVFRNSCGVNILHRIADTGHRVTIGRDALLNGSWDRNLHERGAIGAGLAFEELRARSRIDAAARAAGDAPDFSQRIRAGLPIVTRAEGR